MLVVECLATEDARCNEAEKNRWPDWKRFELDVHFDVRDNDFLRLLEADANCTTDHHYDSDCVRKQERLSVNSPIEECGKEWLDAPNRSHDTDIDSGKMSVVNTKQD